MSHTIHSPFINMEPTIPVEPMKTPFKNIYVDMDGVLVNYYKYLKENEQLKTVKFKDKVLHHLIFEKMEMMPNADILIDVLLDYQREHKCDISILSSCGLYDQAVYNEASYQKRKWLNQFPILQTWPARFTYCGESKAAFARPDNLLIDDNRNNVHNFEWNGGSSILWDGEKMVSSLKKLDLILNQNG